MTRYIYIYIYMCVCVCVCGNKRDVGDTSGIWWKDKEEALVSNVDIDGRNICKYENSTQTLNQNIN